MTNRTMVLVDGSYYLFRAFHAVRGLSNREGAPTGAIYGVINMIRKHLAEGGPDYFAVIFDARGHTFRNDLFADYKANRPPMPDELACQIGPLHEIIRALGIPLLSIDGIEADDVIATLARQASERNIKTIVSTGDKDLAQIVNERVHLINTMNNDYLDRAGVIKKFGLPPERIVDYLALMGDSVDNVPGVPKVGPRTAVKWLGEHGSLAGVIDNAPRIKGKVGENLREFLPRLALSQKLVTLKDDVALASAPEDLTLREADHDTLRALYRQWNFNSWLKQLEADNAGPRGVAEGAGGPAIAADERARYETVLSARQLDKWLDRLRAADLIAFDTETTSLNYMEARIVGVSFAVREDEAAYVPLGHDYADAPAQLPLGETLARLKPILEDPGKAKVGQNLKYDMEVLANYDIRLRGVAADTMLASYVLNSTAGRHDMDSLAARYLGLSTIHYEDVAGKGAKQIPFSAVRIEDAAPYAGEDAEVTLRLHRVLAAELGQTAALRRVYETIEMPLLGVLAGMERGGVLLDPARLKRQGEALNAKREQIQAEAHGLAGEPFNIDSPKQIQQILYERMQLPVLAKTPGGQPSTAESVLQELAGNYELPALILEYRSLSKLISTYIEKLPRMINAKTGRVHTSYHQAVAATGRLSSAAPNLQNIPIRTATGRQIRRAFIAPPGYTLVAADYSQIELRIMAHLSGDRGLLRAFEQGRDIHKTTAAEVFGTGPEAVSAEQRRAAKAINFGLIYGMSAFGLARQLGISRAEAERYVNLYFARYPGVKRYMEQTRAGAREAGYVETLYGRRLYLPDIKARNANRRQYAERTAINAPMQGAAADIIKLAMIDIDGWLQGAALDARMIMQVHDELVFEVNTAALAEFKPELNRRMCANDRLSVPLEVAIGHGANWDEAH